MDGFLPDSGKNPPTRASSESAAAVDADLDALLADVQRERDEYLEIAQRARADFENYRKRAARETQEAERRGKAGLARELVPALDNLERALRAAGIDPETGTPSGEAGRSAQRGGLRSRGAGPRGGARVRRAARGAGTRRRRDLRPDRREVRPCDLLRPCPCGPAATASIREW